jgi:hypothetical protein
METITVVQARNLIETTKDIARFLTEDDYNKVMSVYENACDRFLAECKVRE